MIEKKKKKERWTTTVYAFWPKASSPALLPPDYLNPGGKGDNRRIITLTLTGTYNNNPHALIDGSYAGSFYLNSQPAINVSFLFDFYDSYIITEATWFQNAAITHGIFIWQGSNNNIDYTDIGTQFTLGGISQIQTSLNSNTTSYRYYKLKGVSGNTLDTTYLTEIEFKIGSRTTSLNGCLYSNPGGTGNRSSTFPVPTTDLTVVGVFSSVVNGAFVNSVYFNIQACAGKYIKYDFLTSKLIDEAAWWTTNGNSSQGTWKWQGSNDDSNWTDIGSQFAFGNTILVASNQSLQVLRELRGNTTQYRYYRMLGISGNTSNVTEILEVEFRIAP